MIPNKQQLIDDLEWHRAKVSDQKGRIDSLTAEVEEQARLLGASGSREAKLQARIDVLTADNKDLRDACLQKQEIINSFNEVDKARSAQCWRLQAKMRALENTVKAFVDADQNNNEEVDAAFDALAALLEAEK